MSNQNKSLFKKFLSLFMHLPDETLPKTKETSAMNNKVIEQNKTDDKKNTKILKDAPTQSEVNAQEPSVNNELEKTEEVEKIPSTINTYKRKKSEYAPIVTFNMVSKVFNEGTENEFKALEDIDFEIDDTPNVGEFIALVGPSGCGKSTILNLIQGFQEVGPPTSGEILIRNKPVKSPGRDRGMIFQKYSSFPHLTVLENVMFGLELNAQGFQNSKTLMKKLALDMIKKVGMGGHEYKYPYQLSGGQQQRVAIARTLVLKPRIILMDEPFSALDEPTRIEMQSLITDLSSSIEATVFIVTHSLSEAIYLSDRMFMLSANPGKLQKIIKITPEMIGKEPHLSPIKVQESEKFRAVLKEVTEDFLSMGG